MTTRSETVAGPRLNVDRRRPAAEQIYEQLRQRIVRLVYKPRQPLFESMIAEQSGISRTPVREALQRLRDEGLVEIFVGLGTFVTPLDSARLHEAIRIRTLLEGEAAARAAALPGAGEIGERLAVIVAAQGHALEAADTDRVYELDSSFHQAIFEAADLPTMWGVVRIARANMDRVHYLSLHLDRGSVALAFHDEIARAIAAGDAPAAQDAMTRHILSNASVVAEMAARHPDYLAKP